MDRLNPVFVFLVCAYFWHYTFTYTDWHFIDYVNLIFHEAGHAIFYFFGQFISILAGSITQITIPLLISIYFFWRQEAISGLICLLWVGQNLLNVSLYIKDANLMLLDLLGGDSVIHDWNYLLSSLGMLKNAPMISAFVFSLGVLIIFTSSALALYFSYHQNHRSVRSRSLF